MLVIGDEEEPRDLAVLGVPAVGSVLATGSRWEPYRLIDMAGVRVEAVTAYFRDLQAAGRAEATVRSYGMDLLRWFRFLWAIDVPWDRASRVEARDFCRWLLIAGKPVHDRRRGRSAAVVPTATGAPYAAAVRAHSETVLRGFYDFHRDMGTGPILNPFPLDRSRRVGRGNAHHNPMEPYRNERAGLYRPRVPTRVPRSVPDEEFNEIFARLPSHRDRALVAFYVSTGARASELLSTTQGGVDPGRQLISVVRKGSRELQELPGSTDAFVWLRLYQVEMDGLLPRGRRQPLWWTLRRPVRPLTYHGVHRMFERVNNRAGTSTTLHSLRHTAAYRMAEDPALPLTDVQLVLGHAQLTTTQLYLTPRKEDVIRRVLAHHAEQTRQAVARRSPPPAPGYRPETLDVLFGTLPVTAISAGGQIAARAPVVPSMSSAVPLVSAAAAQQTPSTRFPARPTAVSWPGTERDRSQVLRLAGSSSAQPESRIDSNHRRGLPLLLDWLAEQLGRTWQDRWLASGADAAGDQWARGPARWLDRDGRYSPSRLELMTSSLLVAVGADIVRPSLTWLLTGGKKRKLARNMIRSRDPDGFERLRLLCEQDRGITPQAQSHICSAPP